MHEGGQKGFGRTRVNVVSLKRRIETKKDWKEADFFFSRYLLKVRAIMFVCSCVHNLGVQVFSGTIPSLQRASRKKVSAKKRKEIDYRVYYIYIYILPEERIACQFYLSSRQVGSRIFSDETSPFVMDFPPSWL